MKKAFALLFALILTMSLAACDSSFDGEIKVPSDVNNVDDTNDANNEDTQQAEQPEATEATISETVLVDEAGVKITATKLELKGFMGPEIKLLIENNSGKDLTFQCGYACVNGYMIETMMSVDVVSGKKATDDLTLEASSLEAAGIDSIADIEVAFHIFKTDDWDTYLDTAAIQLRTSIADTFEYTYDDSGHLAYEGNDVKIVVKGLAEDASIFGPSIVVYIENDGDKDITVQVRDVSVNGFMTDSIFSCDIVPGKRAVDTITFSESDLEENGIDTIEDVELSFHIFDSNDWDTIVDTDVVKITF